VKEYSLPLHKLIPSVIESGHLPSIEYLLSREDVCVEDMNTGNLLLSAIRSGSIKVVQRLIPLLAQQHFFSTPTVGPLALWDVLSRCVEDTDTDAKDGGMISYLHRNGLLLLPSVPFNMMSVINLASQLPPLRFFSRSAIEFCLQHEMLTVESLLAASILKARPDIYQLYLPRVRDVSNLTATLAPVIEYGHRDWYSVKNREVAVSLLKLLHQHCLRDSHTVITPYYSQLLSVISAEDILHLQSFGLNSPVIQKKCVELTITSSRDVALDRLKLLIGEKRVPYGRVSPVCVQRRDVLNYLREQNLVYDQL